MNARLTPAVVALLTIPPFMWAANAVVGRVVRELISPATLNFARWLLAFLVLLPFAYQVLRPSSAMWPHWRRFALLGLLGIGIYNAFQYLALQTSTPLNVTLVGSSTPLWMLATGALFFGARVSRREVAGAVLSMAGVVLVLCRGDWHELIALRLVPGDLYMLLATIAWAFYSWLLARRAEPDALRQDWTAFLMAQLVFGLGWSAAFSGGEWLIGAGYVHWSGALALAMVFIAIGPAVLALGCFNRGVQRAGPQMAGFFINLTPLFAALLSAAFLGELPHVYHAVAFALIVGAIVVFSRQPAPQPRGSAPNQ